MIIQAGAVKILAKDVVSIAKTAGDAIMAIYAFPDTVSWDVKAKSDNSPLTAADLAANNLICASLKEKYPSIPIVSEENKLLPYDERSQWPYYWCIDPLDGTKEFIKRNGQFTVNIGLCQGKSPIFGVVHVPAMEPSKTYFGAKGQGAFVEIAGGESIPIQCKEFSETDSGLAIVASASHNTPETEAFIGKFKEPTLKALGSSLKLLMVAEGEAHVYPRLAPTCEWDTCASHAVVEAAGGEVLQAEGGKACTPGVPVEYNKPEALNPFFIVYGKRRK
jgi:3'(2'),5'-bisphosphate nucleotidase